MRRRCRKRWQHNRQRNKNLKNRRTWNNGKNSNRTNPNRCRANVATSPSTSKINWQELEDRWGVKRDNLEKSGDLTKMLNYGKSDLVKVKPTFGGESFELDARLSFKKDGEGNINLVPHFIRKEQAGCVQGTPLNSDSQPNAEILGGKKKEIIPS